MIDVVVQVLQEGIKAIKKGPFFFFCFYLWMASLINFAISLEERRPSTAPGKAPHSSRKFHLLALVFRTEQSILFREDGTIWTHRRGGEPVGVAHEIAGNKLRRLVRAGRFRNVRPTTTFLFFILVTVLYSLIGELVISRKLTKFTAWVVHKKDWTTPNICLKPG